MMIHPVILTVPNFVFDFTRKLRCVLIRQFARKSVEISSERKGYTIGELCKNEQGVPIRCNNFNWSLSHKIKYVAGVVDSFPIGIDIEEILPRSKALYNKIATPREWKLNEKKGVLEFFRYWTAKESVLKAEGVGLAGLANCSIEEIIDEINTVVNYQANIWYVKHFYFDNHVAAVASKNLYSNFSWLVL